MCCWIKTNIIWPTKLKLQKKVLLRVFNFNLDPNLYRKYRHVHDINHDPYNSDYPPLSFITLNN